MQLNPIWIAIVISAVGMVFTWVVAYHASRRGTEVAIARMEERQEGFKEKLVRLENTQDAHAELHRSHVERLAVLERWPHQQPPVDYPR